MTNDTICAVSTAPGVGGIAVVRVSGPDAFAILGKIYKPNGSFGNWEQQKPYTLSFGKILDENNAEIDQVIVAKFVAPHSFTGEDTVEITCHGSLYIQQQLVQLLIRFGCRSALAGEFTQRAFLNGKMDLSQAEAVADLIASNSAATHRLALNQMRGDFSNELIKLRMQLLDFVSLIELELDFSEEEVEFANRPQLQNLADTIYTTIRKLADSFGVGNAIKNGIPTAIVGETNAGKSTLLNRLLHEERALVSDVHGTTRDVIEDVIIVQGVAFRFIDTAGIRETADQIETMGIERTFRKIDQATIVLWLIDATTDATRLEELAQKIVPLCTDKKLILLYNKIDKLSADAQRTLQKLLPGVRAERLYISAKTNSGIEELENKLVAAAQLPETSSNDIIVTNARHYEALTHALRAVERVQEGLTTGLSGDFISQDIRECMHYIGEITGQISTDEILGNIFGKFCIGK